MRVWKERRGKIGSGVFKFDIYMGKRRVNQ